MASQFLRYKYYDTPEGEDLYKKLFVTSKYGAMFGLWVSFFDVLQYSHPKNYRQTIGRILYITVPIVAMSAAFTTSSYFAAKLRGKDDKLNYVIGACSAAPITAVWGKTIMTGFVSCIGFSLAAVLKKMSVEDGWEFFPDPGQPSRGSLWGQHADWTITAERPRNWTTELEEPKVEEPKVEEPKVEEPKVEEPKVEEPKVEEPKVEEPKV